MTANDTNKRLDFSKIDLLRKSLLLTVGNMSSLYGVSRETYYNWLEGKYPRKKLEQSVRAKTRQLLEIIAVHGWPTSEVIVSDQKTRYQKLLELMSSQS